MRVRKTLAAVAGTLLLSGIAPAAALTTSSAVPVARLDPDLVTQLADVGATDQLLVFVHATDGATANRAVAIAGLRPVETFRRIGVAVALGTPAQIGRVRLQPGVRYLEADQPLSFLMETSHLATRGEEARHAFQNRMVTTTTTTRPPKRNGKPGKPVRTTTTAAAFAEEIDGSGVTIAVIDSGIDGTHPMFQVDTDGDGEADASKVVRNLKHLCATGVLIPATGPCIGDPTTAEDPSTGTPYGDAHDEAFVDLTDLGNDTDNLSAGGHGTHVAGIAAGTDVTTSDGRALHGAAPGASLVGLSVGASVSVYGGFAGLNWVLEHHADPCGDGSCPPIRVVNNSWGWGGAFDPESAGAKLQDLLVEEGVVVAWAAGNDGGDGSDDMVNPPAKSPTPGILNVASYDDLETGTREGVVSSFSSRGHSGELETYPDVSAPGSNITSACRITLTVCGTGLDTRDPDYNTIGGTSMATPHIAGIVAQLLQVDPTLTPAEVEDTLEDTAHKFTDGAAYEADLTARNDDDLTSYDKGHGLVDVVAAVESILGLATPAAESPGDTPTTPTPPAPPADATLGAGDSYQASGELDGFYANYTCESVEDESCFDTVVAVAEGTLSMTLDATPGSDFDVYLYDLNGNEVASSAAFGSFESFEQAVSAGTYHLLVQPYAGAPGMTFTADLALA